MTNFHLSVLAAPPPPTLYPGVVGVSPSSGLRGLQPAKTPRYDEEDATEFLCPFTG